MTSARACLTAIIVCGVATWANSAQAQDGYDASTGVQGQCVSNCGTSSDSGYHTDLTFQDLFRSFLPSNPRGSRASASNHEAVVAQQAGNLDEALRLFRRAHDQDSSDLVIRSNLMSVLVQVAWRNLQRGHDLASLNAIERLLDEMDGLRNPNIATEVSYYGEILDAGARVRAEIDYWRQVPMRERQNAQALANASDRISNITGNVAADLNRQGGAAANSDLGFGDPSAVAGLRDGPNNPAQRTASLDVNTDPSVVDLRDASTTPTLMVSLPPSLPRLQAVENSPGRETWAQGMYAVIGHDWERAAEFFSRAHALDPNNTAITNALTLAEWTRDFYRRAAALPAEQRRVVDSRYAEALRHPEDSDLQLLFSAPTPSQELRATPEERARRDMAQRTGAELPEDMDLLRDTNQTRSDMVDNLTGGSRSYLASRGAAITANDWTDQLAPEIRGMLAELREAFPTRTYGPPRPGHELDNLREETGSGMADYAIVRILNGDLEGAERSLNEANDQSPGYVRALDLVRDWRGVWRGDNGITGLAPGGTVQH